MKVCAPHQPVVFGYTPKGRGTIPSSHEVNSGIKEVSDAIKAAIEQNKTNRSVYLVSGIALLAIAGLAYQNYSLAQDNNALQQALNLNLNTPQLAASSYQPKTHETYDDTPFANRWSLDLEEGRPWCAEILTYGNRSMSFEQRVEFIRELFSQSADQITAHLSQAFNAPSIKKGHVRYSHCAPKDTSCSPNILGMLIAHECVNTVQSIVDEGLVPSFDQEALVNAKELATAALSPYALTLLKTIAAKDPNHPENWGIGEFMGHTDPHGPEDGIITVQVRLSDHLPPHVLGPTQHNQARGLQQQFVNTEEYRTWAKSSLIGILERKDSRGQPVNIGHEHQKRRVLRFLAELLHDNRPFAVALTKEMATLINDNGLTFDVQNLVEKGITALSVA